MTTYTAPRTGRRAALLAGVLALVVASSSECDVGCDAPDPSSSDGWLLPKTSPPASEERPTPG